MQTKRVPIESVSLDPANTRKHGARNLDAIKASLQAFGQQHPIIVDSRGIVLAGNGRLMAAKALGWKHIEIIQTELQGSEAVAFAIADNRTAELAEWDSEALATTLAALQNDEEFDHLVAGFTDAEIEALVNGAAGLDDESPYTRKIEAPIYRARQGQPPELAVCYDQTKANELQREIEASGVAGELREFLLAAAARHTVFNFENIAELYCHAAPEVQRLMEKSALIVIDFDKAIECGYVRMGEELAEMYGKEYGTA